MNCAFVQVFYLCTEFSYSEENWDKHCQFHLANLQPQCSILTFWYILVGTELCPFWILQKLTLNLLSARTEQILPSVMYESDRSIQNRVIGTATRSLCWWEPVLNYYKADRGHKNSSVHYRERAVQLWGPLAPGLNSDFSSVSGADNPLIAAIWLWLVKTIIASWSSGGTR